MTTAAPGNTITSNTDLRGHWASLMGEEGFGRRSLWLIFVERDRTVAPLVVPIDDIPDEPDDHTLRDVAQLVGRARAELGVGSIPMLLSRPGPSEMTESDRRWARALSVAFREQQPQWPIHLATAGEVQVFAPDDLL